MTDPAARTECPCPPRRHAAPRPDRPRPAGCRSRARAAEGEPVALVPHGFLAPSPRRLLRTAEDGGRRTRANRRSATIDDGSEPGDRPGAAPPTTPPRTSPRASAPRCHPRSASPCCSTRRSRRSRSPELGRLRDRAAAAGGGVLDRAGAEYDKQSGVRWRRVPARRPCALPVRGRTRRRITVPGSGGAQRPVGASRARGPCAPLRDQAPDGTSAACAR